MSNSRASARPDQTPWRSSRVAMRKAEDDRAGSQQGRATNEGKQGASSRQRQLQPPNGTNRQADEAGSDALHDALSKMSIAPPADRSLHSSQWASSSAKPAQVASVREGQVPARRAAAGGATVPAVAAARGASSPASSPSRKGRASVIAEAEGLKPRDMSRPLGGKLDPMALLASPSRGLDASNLDNLLDGDITDLHVQTRFRAHISEQIQRHAAKFGRTDDAGPSSEREEKQASLSSIILLARKLREGLIASSAKGRDLGPVQEPSEATALLVDTLELSVVLALLSEPPNVAQLQAALPRLVESLSIESVRQALSCDGQTTAHLEADLASSLPADRLLKEQAISSLSGGSEDSLYLCCSLQLLLALYSTGGRGGNFGHTEYLTLYGELHQKAMLDHPFIQFVHRLHHALLHRDAAAVRQLILDGAQPGAEQRIRAPTFWHLQLLSFPDSFSASKQEQASTPAAAAAAATSSPSKSASSNLVGTTSNAVSAQTTSILDRFRASLWDCLVQAYKPMGLPLEPALLLRTSHLPPDVQAQLQSLASEASTADRSASTWLERTLLLDHDFVSALHRLRTGRDLCLDADEALSMRKQRIDHFLSRAERGLGGADWVKRVDVKADGRNAILRLK
ncbi:hypothetical protein V8E36_000806 [Tilletia maclaganii]